MMLDTQTQNKDSAMPRLLSRKKVAEILGVSAATIGRYETRAEFPRPIVMPGGQIRFMLSEIEGFIASLRA